MPNTSICNYRITWRTCRNKPLIQGKTERLLFRLLDQISEKNDLHTLIVDVYDEGREVVVFVSTNNLELSPNSIAYLLRHGTGGVIRRSHPDFKKLPAIWTSKYTLETYGELDE